MPRQVRTLSGKKERERQEGVPQKTGKRTVGVTARSGQDTLKKKRQEYCSIECPVRSRYTPINRHQDGGEELPVQSRHTLKERQENARGASTLVGEDTL